MKPLDYLPVEEVEDSEFYIVQVHKSKLRNKPRCKHAFWICKCSLCGEILGSETKPDIIVNIVSQLSIVKIVMEEVKSVEETTEEVVETPVYTITEEVVKVVGEETADEIV